MIDCNNCAVKLLRYLEVQELNEFCEHANSCPCRRESLAPEEASSQLLRYSCPLYSATAAFRKRISMVRELHHAREREKISAASSH